MFGSNSKRKKKEKKKKKNTFFGSSFKQFLPNCSSLCVVLQFTFCLPVYRTFRSSAMRRVILLSPLILSTENLMVASHMDKKHVSHCINCSIISFRRLFEEGSIQRSCWKRTKSVVWYHSCNISNVLWIHCFDMVKAIKSGLPGTVES